MLIGFFLCILQASAGQDVVTILHVNDTHSFLSSTGPRQPDLKGTIGGLARVATYIAQERMKSDNVLFLHGGDFFVGDMFFNAYFGVPELQILQSLGCDAIAVGNHEFDLNPFTLLSALETAFPGGSGIPLLSANLVLDDPAVKPLRDYIFGSTIRRMGKVHAGIFGLTTPATNDLSNADPAFLDDRLVAIADSMVRMLTSRGCNLIICLSHDGILVDRVLAEAVPGIDIIIGGHDHFVLKRPEKIHHPDGQKTWIVQAASFYMYVGEMKVQVHDENVRVLDYRLVEMNENIPEDPVVTGTVQYLIDGIEQTYGPVYSAQIGVVTDDFDEVAVNLFDAGPKDTPIGNFVGDVYKSTMGTDVAIQVGGSTAHALYAGPIVPADLFRVVGYGFNTDNGLGFRMATFTMTGASLYSGLEVGVAGLEENFDEFLVQSSGIRYTYNPGNPPFSRVTAALVNGEPLDPFASYSIAANELVPMFLDVFGISYENLVVHPGLSEAQVLWNYVAANPVLTPLREGRVICDPTSTAPAALRAPAKAHNGPGNEFALEQNFPNPFNPSTTFHFSIPTASFVTLKIFNVIGQEVDVLVSETKEPGSFEVAWSAAGLPSGVYIARLEAGGMAATRSLVLLK